MIRTINAPGRFVALVLGLVMTLALAAPTAAIAQAERDVHTHDVQWSFQDLNPCTGELHIVTIAGPVVHRTIENAGGGANVQWHADFEVTTDSGYTGWDRSNSQLHVQDAQNHRYHDVLRVRARGPEGVIVVKGTITMGLEDGQFYVERDEFELTCSGS